MTRAAGRVAVAVALGLVAWSLGGGSFAGTAADAAARVTLATNPVPVARGGTTPVVVRWSGFRPRTLVFIRICGRSIADPTFDEGLDCSLVSELTPNGTPDGSGTATVSVFRGPEPGGDDPWGCFASGDAAPPGVRAERTCYVRVTVDRVGNRLDAVEAPFRIVPGAPTPGATADAGATAVAGATVTVPGADSPAAISLTG